MHAETMTIDRASQAAGRWLAPGVPGRPARQPALFREQLWRQSYDGARSVSTANILASRWTDERTTARQERSDGASGRYVIAVALRPVRMRLGREGGTVFEGTMPTGMIHVTEPGQIVEA